MRLISKIPYGIAVSVLALATLSGVAISQGTILQIQLGHSSVLRPDRAPEIVIVGNSSVADATVIADRSVLVTGKSVGQTNLILADESGEVTFTAIIEIVPLDRRPQTRVRVVEGGGSDDGTIYVCGPEPGCSPLGQGSPAPTAPVSEADASVDFEFTNGAGASE